VKTALAYTLQRLGTDYIDLYHRPARSGSADRGHDQRLKWCKGYVGAHWFIRSSVDTIRRVCGSSNHLLQIDCSSAVALRLKFFRQSVNWALESRLMACFRGVVERSLVKGTPFTGLSSSFATLLRREFDRNLSLVALRSIAQEQNATVAQVAIVWVCRR